MRLLNVRVGAHGVPLPRARLGISSFLRAPHSARSPTSDWGRCPYPLPPSNDVTLGALTGSTATSDWGRGRVRPQRQNGGGGLQGRFLQINTLRDASVRLGAPQRHIGGAITAAARWIGGASASDRGRFVVRLGALYNMEQNTARHAEPFSSIPFQFQKWLFSFCLDGHSAGQGPVSQASPRGHTVGMNVTDTQLLKLAMKLIEVFSRAREYQTRFHRYWPLAGRLEAFCASAKGVLEEGVAKALRIALERSLKDAAPHSLHDDADAAATLLGSKRRFPSRRAYPRRWR